MALPIVPWLGGKRRLADKLIPLFPPHECYVEVFAGGAALFFLRPVPAPVEVLNDINGELVNLYRVVQHHMPEFLRQFEWALSSREWFERFQLQPPGTLTDVQRAARFYFLQQHAFAGRIDGQSFGTATTGRPVDLHNIERNLSQASRRLGGTFVENLSWQEVIERYDRPHTFFYCDPPYWKTEGYGVPFGFEQYLALADIMRRCQGRVMVSINDHPDIRAAFAGFWIRELDIQYSTANRHGSPKTSRELVIANWSAEAFGDLFGAVAHVGTTAEGSHAIARAAC